MENNLQYGVKLKMPLTTDLVMTLPGTCSGVNLETLVHMRNKFKGSYTAVFVIMKNQEQPECPLGGEWINKLLCSHTMEYETAVKMNEPDVYQLAWILKCNAGEVGEQIPK